MTDLQTRISEFLATAYSPDNPLTARDKLDQAVGLLEEAIAPKSFADFIRNATKEQMEKVYEDVLSGATKRQQDILEGKC